MREYRSDMDVLGQWIDSKCDLGNAKTVGVMTAYQSYGEWARANGLMQMSCNAFGWRLKVRFPRKKTNTGQLHAGLAVKST